MPLSLPQSDADGVIPHDHAEIVSGDRAIRRINPRYHIWTDKRTGKRRLSSMLFKGGSGPRDGMSVDLEAQIIEANLDPVAYVSVDPWFGAIVFRVGDLRGAGLMVGFNPIQGNPHHGEVWGNYPKHRDFAALAQWFVELPEVSIAP